MSSQLTSTTANKKRKLAENEADEVFVLDEKPDLTFTKTVSFSIPNLLDKINDEKNKRKPIPTPRFKLGHLDFYFQVNPTFDEGYVGFFLVNPNKEKAIISIEMTEMPEPEITEVRSKLNISPFYF